MLPGGTPNQARDALFQSEFLEGARTSKAAPILWR
jgi:hypothetical protein